MNSSQWLTFSHFCAMSLPQPSLKTKIHQGIEMVWDRARKKWILLTPEEYVRQALIHFLVDELAYPLNWIAVEKQIKVNGLVKRFDALVYDKNHQPWLLVECKAPSIAITAEVFDQIARYNLHFSAPFLVVTNGRDLFCAKVHREPELIEWLEHLPPLDRTND
jgi:hypothetical protein